MELLERFDLSSIAHKFQENGVTVDILWDLDDEIFSELNLSKVEILRYKKAKNKNFRQEEARTGNSFFTWTIVIILLQYI